MSFWRAPIRINSRPAFKGQGAGSSKRSPQSPQAEPVGKIGGSMLHVVTFPFLHFFIFSINGSRWALSTGFWASLRWFCLREREEALSPLSSPAKRGGRCWYRGCSPKAPHAGQVAPSSISTPGLPLGSPSLTSHGASCRLLVCPLSCGTGGVSLCFLR